MLTLGKSQGRCPPLGVDIEAFDSPVTTTRGPPQVAVESRSPTG
jgi:hypothetical protein